MINDDHDETHIKLKNDFIHFNPVNNVESIGISKSRLLLMIIGVLLVIGSAVMLFLNEAFPSTADVVRATTELTQANAQSLNGSGVWVCGEIRSNFRASDERLIPLDVIVLRRYTQVRTRFQHNIYDDEGNVVGQQTSYDWQLSSAWRNVANGIEINGFPIDDALNMDFVDLPVLNLTGRVVAGRGTISNNRLYPAENRGTPAFPQVNDQRFVYTFLSNGASGIAIAQFNDGVLQSFTYGSSPFTRTVYAFHLSANEITTLIQETESPWVLWGLRSLGFLMAMIGFWLSLSCLRYKLGHDKFSAVKLLGLGVAAGIIFTICVCLTGIYSANIATMILCIAAPVILFLPVILVYRRHKTSTRDCF